MKIGLVIRSLTLMILITLGLLTPLVSIPRSASAYIPHAPIQISADGDFVVANGVTGGSGTLGDPFMIEGWEISGFPQYGIHVYGTTAHFIIQDVYLHSGPGNWYAVYLNGAANAHIWNSTITTSDIGIRIRNCENVTLVDNDVSQNLVGLSVYLATNLTISDNRIEGNSEGMSMGDSDGVFISGNRFTDNRQTGIFFTPSTNVLIMLNNFSNSEYNGISISHGEGLVIEDNEFYNIYGGAGIRTYESTNCIFRGNTFSYSKYGVNLGYLSQGNRIYHNNFVFNTIPGDNRNALTTNYWDNGYPSGGNYWSNYTGVDNCRGVDQNICPSPDGIGDIPNPIDPSSIADYYPLMGPYVDKVPPTISITSPNDGAVFDFSPVNVAGTASDPGGGGQIRAVEVRANIGMWKMATGTASWTTLVGLKQGLNLIEARSWDYAGNPSVIDSISVVYNPPVNNPPVAFFTISPSTGNVTTTFAVDASSSSDPEDPVSVLEARWDWEDDGTWDTAWSTTKTATQKYTEEGTYTITLQVRDTGGMTDETSEQVIVEALIPPQNEPPTCGIMDPISGTEISGTYAIEGTASDADGNVQIVEIKIDGGPWIATEGTSSWTYIWNTTLVDDGQHTIQARSFDGEDYSGLVSMTVLVDNTEPPPDGHQDGFLTSSVIVWMSIVIAAVVLLILIILLLLGGRRRVDEEPHGRFQQEPLEELLDNDGEP